MAKRLSMKRMRMEAPEWIFGWRKRHKDVPYAKWFAMLVVTGFFIFLITSVRIRISTPPPWAERKASVIRVLDDAEGRALNLRAQEGGPFLSRFEPSQWKASIEIEKAALEAARWTPPPYVPILRDLPDARQTPGGNIAIKGEPVFPKHRHQNPVVVTPETPTLKPSLYPLSDILAATMPRELPVFDGTVDPTMAAENWRFIVRLDSAGNVRDCTSLAGGDETGVERTAQLETWLRGIQFKSAPKEPSRWIALGIGFNIQSSHGTEPN